LDRAFNLAMDGDLWDRFAQRGAIAHLSRYLSCMRCYPEQKTRALRPQAKAENAALRMRRSGAFSEYLRPLLYPCAKALRVASKTLNGAYVSQVPDEHLLWLQRVARLEAHPPGVALS
jgi:hypothetical protein